MAEVFRPLQLLHSISLSLSDDQGAEQVLQLMWLGCAAEPARDVKIAQFRGSGNPVY